ncbi:hypothetical protein B566_EDAN000946 [Ephemera danica]|nr:hypothetical protein B566_EDAN000946 [Ephemera danica]
MESKRCYRIDDDTHRHSTHKFDPVRDLIIPGIIVMTIGAMMYLGIKLFCTENYGNEARIMNHPEKWRNAFRIRTILGWHLIVFSGPGGNLHPAPCLLVPGPASTMSPPPYEEALKHKILLSSYPVSLAAVCPPPPPLPMVLPPLPPPHHEAILHPVPSSSTATNQGSGS